jgi:hypothetical protein
MTLRIMYFAMSGMFVIMGDFIHKANTFTEITGVLIGIVGCLFVAFYIGDITDKQIESN